MNNKFEELTKGLARSVTRRGAFKKFGVGLAGLALAALGLVNKAEAGGPHTGNCNHCVFPYGCTTDACISKCAVRCKSGCC